MVALPLAIQHCQNGFGTSEALFYAPISFPRSGQTWQTGECGHFWGPLVSGSYYPTRAAIFTHEFLAASLRSRRYSTQRVLFPRIEGPSPQPRIASPRRGSRGPAFYA